MFKSIRQCCEALEIYHEAHRKQINSALIDITFAVQKFTAVITYIGNK